MTRWTTDGNAKNKTTKFSPRKNNPVPMRLYKIKKKIGKCDNDYNI